MRKIFIYLYCMSFFLFMPDIVLANQDALSREVKELKNLVMEMKNDYESRINDMQMKIAKLEKINYRDEEEAALEKELELLFNGKEEQVVINDQQAVSSVPAASGGFTGGSMFRNLMMDVSVIGDSIANVTWPEKSIDTGRAGSPFAENEFADRISLREMELGLQGVLDPLCTGRFLHLVRGRRPSNYRGRIYNLALPPFWFTGKDRYLQNKFWKDEQVSQA